MIGIDPKDVRPVSWVPIISNETAERRIRGVELARRWIWERFGLDDVFTDESTDSWGWEHWWRQVPYGLLAHAFSRDEIVRFWQESVISTTACDFFETHEPWLWKLCNSLWQYGGERSFDRLVDMSEGLPRLDSGVPGLETRLTWTRSINTAAWAEHGRENPVYIDASFGLLLHWRGQHVLTIGFAPARRGILIAQVQLRHQRGNRFLYSLPMHPLDLAIDILRRAYPNEDLWLVTGTSSTHAIRRAYGKDLKLADDTAARIETLYGRELEGYVRIPGDEVVSHTCGRRFTRLESKAYATWLRDTDTSRHELRAAGGTP